MKIVFILFVFSFHNVFGDYATKSACQSKDGVPVSNLPYFNRAQFVTIGDRHFCWRANNADDWYEADSGKECQEFTDGQLMDLNDSETESYFKRTLTKQGADNSWSYWIKGQIIAELCPYYNYALGKQLLSCSSSLVYYCQYPIIEEFPKATESACKSLDGVPPSNLPYFNRAEFVTIGDYHYCWRANNAGDWFEANSGTECQEFRDGQLMDLSKDDAQALFRGRITNQDATNSWSYWIKGQIIDGKCHYYNYALGKQLLSCSSSLVYYCQYPIN